MVKKSLCFGGRTFTDVPFVLAAVARPILGADFFAAHSLLVDSASHSVLDAVSLQPVSGEKGLGRSPLVTQLSVVPTPVRELLAAFPGVVGTGTTTPKPLHGVEHTIETAGRPLFARSRRLDPVKLRIAEFTI